MERLVGRPKSVCVEHEMKTLGICGKQDTIKRHAVDMVIINDPTQESDAKDVLLTNPLFDMYLPGAGITNSCEHKSYSNSRVLMRSKDLTSHGTVISRTSSASYTRSRN